MEASPYQRLEEYTRKRSQEVLLVETENDQIAIFKGCSSSLMRSTAFDPDTPIIAENEAIICIDRLKSPYEPNNPQYIAQGLTWEQMEGLLIELEI